MSSQQTLVPPDAVAAVLNLTVTNPTARGYLTIFPADIANANRPNASNVNWDPGESTSNSQTADLGAIDASHSGVKIYNGSSGPVDVIVDLQGFYS